MLLKLKVINRKNWEIEDHYINLVNEKMLTMEIVQSWLNNQCNSINYVDDYTSGWAIEKSAEKFTRIGFADMRSKTEYSVEVSKANIPEISLVHLPNRSN